MPDLPKTIIKLAAELIKYQAKRQLGEGFVNTLAEGLTDYIGENITERLNAFLNNGENSKKLLAAFHDADKAFASTEDKTLQQMIISKPLNRLEHLEKLASNLPNTLDDKNIFEALRNQFANDWPNLSSKIHIRAATLYRTCLERALAIRCNFLLPSIFTKVERIEYNTEKIIDKLDTIHAMVNQQTSSRHFEISTSQSKIFRLYNVPDLPDNFLPRDEDLLEVINLLTHRDGRRVAITGGSLRVGLQGMGGVGKSVLAAAVAHNSEIKKLFPDGVFWITFGQNPDLEILQGLLGKAIGDPTLPYNSIQEGRANLNEALKDKTSLIILDDIWKEDHAEAFDLHSKKCCLLLTSRNRQAMEIFGTHIHMLDTLNESDSLSLLSNWAGYDLVNIPVESIDLAKQIIKECGYLPLALAMAGALIKEQSWKYVLYRLRSADLSDFSRRFPYDHPNLLRAIQVSIEDLPEDFRKLYLDFAVFPEDTSIPRATLQTLWANPGLDEEANEFETQKAIKLFVGRSLLRIQKDQGEKIILHDLQMDYIRKGVDLKMLHQKIVKAYRKGCTAGWHSGPNDGYFIQHITWHLLNAGFESEFYSLLGDYRWLKYKLTEGEINSLILDYDLVKKDDDSTFWLIQLSLRLARHILSKDIYQLPTQLIGRLSLFDNKNIDLLLDNASKEGDWLWLKPLSSTLTHPGAGELMTLEGHKLGVRSVVVQANGKQAISASEDKTIKIWDLENGRCIQTLNVGGEPSSKHQGDDEERGGYINALLLTQDQKHVISAMHDHTIKVWNLENGMCVKTFNGHTERVYALALTPDEKNLISGSGDKTVKIWSMKTGVCLATLTEHTNAVRAIVVNPHNRFYSGDEDGTINVWHLTSYRLMDSIKNCGSLRSMSLSLDSEELIFSGREGLISTWNISSGKPREIFEGHKHLVRCVTTVKHNNNELIASASSDHNIKIWGKNGMCLYTFEGHSKSVNCIVQIPFERTNRSGNISRIISGSEDGTLKIWDLNINDQQQLISKKSKAEQHKGPIKMLTCASGEKTVVSASQDGILKRWDLKSGKYICDLSKHSKAINALAVSQDGNIVVSAGNDNKISVWDIEKNRVINTYKSGGKILALAFVPNEKKIIYSSYELNIQAILGIWNFDSSNNKSTWSHGNDVEILYGHTEPVYFLQVTADGARLISGARGKDNVIAIWDMKTNKRIHTLKAHRRFATSMVLSPNGKLLATGLWNTKIKIWDIEKGECLRILEGHTESVHSLAISPNGKTIVSGSWDKTFRTWNIETGECLHVFNGHSEIVNAVSVSPNGQYIISAANDNTLKVWDINNGKCLFTYWADAPIYTVITNSHSNIIVAGDQTGKVHYLEPMWR